MNGEREQLETTPHGDDLVRLSDGREIEIYLHDGMAWVAELKDGRARVSSLSAWFSANQGGRVLRSRVRPPAGLVFPALARLAAWLASGVAAFASRRLAARRAAGGGALRP